MAKFYNSIGFATTVEVRPGVKRESITERNYYGDILENSVQLQESGEVIDDVNISTRISILADPFANEHFHAIRYVTFMGAKWKVRKMTPAFPRIILSLGGVYNGEQA